MKASIRPGASKAPPRWRPAFSAAAVAAVAAASLLTGLLAFGWHPLTVLDLQHTTGFRLAATTFAPADALARIAVATGLVACTMASTFAFSLVLSTPTASPFSAAAGGFGLGSRALDNVPGLHALGPWLPMTDGGSTLWTNLFLAPGDLGGLGHLLAVQAACGAVFLGAAWVRFARTDVLRERGRQ